MTEWIKAKGYALTGNPDMRGRLYGACPHGITIRTSSQSIKSSPVVKVGSGYCTSLCPYNEDWTPDEVKCKYQLGDNTDIVISKN